MKKNLLLSLFALFAFAGVAKALIGIQGDANKAVVADADKLGGQRSELFTYNYALRASQICDGLEIVIKSLNVAESDSWVSLEKHTECDSRFAQPTYTEACIFIVEDGGTSGTIVLKRKSDDKYLKFGTPGGVTQKNQATLLTVTCPEGVVQPNANQIGIGHSYVPSWGTDGAFRVRFTEYGTSNHLNITNSNMCANGTGSWSAYYVMKACDPTTGQVGIESVKAATDSQVLYNLRGERVNKPAKGIYVNGAGKKVLFQ